MYAPLENGGESHFYKNGLKIIGLGDRETAPAIIESNYGYWDTYKNNKGHVKIQNIR